MIRRVYIDNYKCLTNFDCRFDSISLILGNNGSGKSALFEALRSVRDFVTGKSPIAVFERSTLTRWQKRDVQAFELDVEGNGGVYSYRLEIEQEPVQQKQRVKLETVEYDGKPLYRAELAEVRLYRDDHSAGPEISKDWTQSGLLSLGERHDNTLVTWLKKWFREKLFFLQLDPLHIKPMAGVTESELDANAANFVGWYRHRIATDMTATIDLYKVLAEMYQDFGGLRLEQEGGDIQHLFITFGVQQEETGQPVNARYSFGDLSDGERCLIVLYTLLQVMADRDVTVCIDEPDNYVALSEIQPWLTKLQEQVDTSHSQALMVSHHPEILNSLAETNGLLFNRPNNAHVRVTRYAADGSGLPPSEVVARGDL